MSLFSGEKQIDESRIRQVETSHIGDLIRIAEETNLSHWSAQSYLEEMKNADSIMMSLVSPENTIFGFVVGRLVLGGNTELQTDAEIYNIAVTKAKQNSGYGQILLDEFSRVCRTHNVVNIWLEVRESNLSAIAFYAKNGFCRVQTRNHFYENPREHAILMRLIL